MDPVSQGTLGAALAGSASGQNRVRSGVMAGTVAGMAPDLDVLIRSAADPLLFLEYHRQFTHALVFVPIGALVCATLLYPLLRGRLGFGALFGFSMLGYGTHGLLDACTSYGTQLLWPFSGARIAWNAVAVVDPLFTLPLLGLLAWAVFRRRPGAARLALVWALTYVGLGLVQGGRAQEAGVALAEARGHTAERLLAKPSFGNLLVWKTVYADDGWYYVDAVRVSLDVTWFPGERIPRLDVDRMLPWLASGSRQARDLERFRRFSDGFLAPAPGREHAVIDVRYSLLPNEIDPLWGLRLDPGQPDRHGEFFTDRNTSAQDRHAFVTMLLGPGQSLAEAVAAHGTGR